MSSVCPFLNLSRGSSGLLETVKSRISGKLLLGGEAPRSEQHPTVTGELVFGHQKIRYQVQTMENVHRRKASDTPIGQLRNQQDQQDQQGPQRQDRAPTSRLPASFGANGYGYLTALGLVVLCMLVYFFGSPTCQLLSGQASSSSSTVLPQQIPQPSLSPQLPPDQLILETPSKPPKAVTMPKINPSERT